MESQRNKRRNLTPDETGAPMRSRRRDLETQTAQSKNFYFKISQAKISSINFE